ncbi:hypothetical protein ABEF95_013975 [Exophiala dermatitidis]
MSFTNTQSRNTQRPTPYLSPLAAPKAYRSSPAQSQSHNRSTSVTSNPTQTAHEPPPLGSELDCWTFDQTFSAPVASPASLPQSTYLLGLEEDTSHHESSFDDFLTTGYSSENHVSEHTTPQELIWEQQFVYEDNQPYILDNCDQSGDGGSHEFTQSSDLQAFYPDAQEALPDFVSGHSLANPKLNTSIDHSLHLSRGTQSLMPGQDQSMERPSNGRSQTNHATQNLRVSTTRNHTSTTFPNHGVSAWQRTSPNMRAPSPVVMVSSYEAPDPNNGTQTAQAQNSNKRSRGGTGSNVDDEVEDDDDDNDEDDDDEGVDNHLGGGNPNVASSHLMPPAPIGSNNTSATAAQRSGLEPMQRSDDVVLSLKELEEQRQRDERNAEVQTWLETSDDGGQHNKDIGVTSMRGLITGGRRRAHTTGQMDAIGRMYSDKNIPGPGLLLEVDSDDESSDEESISSSQMEGHTNRILDTYYHSESPRMSPRALEELGSPNMSFPPLEDDTPPELQEPLPRQFYRRSPWQDPVRGPVSDTRDQPDTSNAAVYRFNQEAAKWETASRAATWGTRRRLSESEIRSIVEGSQVRHLSLSKRGRERGNSILNKARGLLPRRSSSNVKTESPAESQESAPTSGHAHRSSIGTIKPTQRKPSFSNKPKSPPLDTGSAFMAMTGQLAAIGRANAMTQDADTHKSSGPLQALRKHRSKSDVSKHGRSSSATPGLTELMTRHGGPPIPTLASPMHERERIVAAQVLDNEEAPADDDEDDQADEVAIRMDFEIRAEEITPTLEGFRDHARRLNPRLEPYMIERIGQEQIRRYKKLVETKIKHTRAVQMNQKCPSGKFCFELGGEAALLAPRVSVKDPEATLTQFQVCNPADDEIDEAGFTEGIVTPALFPAGIPLPPVKRLPAELECPLCFKVKKFQKPSDWTKHVHEDIQPFSCTFPHCPESKSFKRKADWVRHENELHRHLEWWKCNIEECSHICYRKDNFVQHLVREHKMKEPKVRSRGSASSKNKAVNNNVDWSEDAALWRLVDSCRHETTKKPHDEPCRFCGNICSSWKKLSVHLGKHLEQIALPVLQLVRIREVAPDTVISPIDQAPPSTIASTHQTGLGTINNTMDANASLSPYPRSATLAYQTSSAGQSPASGHGPSRNGGFQQFDTGFYSDDNMTAGMHVQMTGNMFPGSSATSMPQQPHMYMGTSEYMQPGDVGQRPHEYSVSPHSSVVTPRSQPQPVTATGYNHNGQFFETVGLDYTQPMPMAGMYSRAGVQSSPGYGLQYASPSMQHNQHLGQQQPGVVDSQSAGLGLQPRNQHYVFQDHGHQQGQPGSGNMQYTQ